MKKEEKKNNQKNSKPRSEHFDPFKFRVKDQIPEDIYATLCDYEGYLAKLNTSEKEGVLNK